MSVLKLANDIIEFARKQPICSKECKTISSFMSLNDTKKCYCKSHIDINDVYVSKDGEKVCFDKFKTKDEIQAELFDKTCIGDKFAAKVAEYQNRKIEVYYEITGSDCGKDCGFSPDGFNTKYYIRRKGTKILEIPYFIEEQHLNHEWLLKQLDFYSGGCTKNNPYCKNMGQNWKALEAKLITN